MNQTRHHIVILGAGYAGLLAAIRLARKTRRMPVSITLISDSATFTERLRLHEYGTGQQIAWRWIAQTLSGTGVKFVQATVKTLTPARKEVTLTRDGVDSSIEYDYLVYALGSETDRDRVPGVAEYAYTLAPRGPHSAEALRMALPGLPDGSRIVICGGGATGIETAAQIASVYPSLRVSLVTRGRFGDFLGEGVSRVIRRRFARLHISIMEQLSVTELAAHGIQLASGQCLDYDLCVWTGGFEAKALAREAGLLVNERGQIIIDPFMRAVSADSIYAIGDAAHTREEPGAPLRMSALNAMTMAAHGADCLAATLKGKAPKPFSFAYIGQGIALGRRNAIGYGKTALDVAYPPYLTGRLGFLIRDAIVRFLGSAPEREKHWLSQFTWVGKNRYAKTQHRHARDTSSAAKPATASH